MNGPDAATRRTQRVLDRAHSAVVSMDHHGRVTYFRHATITAKGHKTRQMTYNGIWHLS